MTTKRSKKDLLLDAAQAIFISHGYAGTSVDDVARAAGASKATLYSHFEDKRDLFTAMVARMCDVQAAALKKNTDGLPTEKALVACGKTVSAFTATPAAQGIFRICVAESERFPQVGRAFFETGPKVISAQIVDLIVTAENAGDLDVPDKQTAAVHFFLLCRGPHFYPILFKLKEGVSQHDRMIGLREGLTTFSARYGSPDLQKRMESELARLR